MEKAKTATEVTVATIKEKGKTVVADVMVVLNTEESSPKHKELYGSFKLSPDTPLALGFYQLLLKDGCSYRIEVIGVHLRKEKAFAHFLVVLED